MSVALEIGRLAEEKLGARAARLVEVGVVVGDEAGVEPGSLAFCLEAVLGTPPFSAARPVIHRAAGDELRLEYLEVDDDGPED